MSVVVPVFDESGNLAPLVEEIERALTGRFRFEALIVDDGSTDDTSAEAARLAATRPWLRIERHATNRGQSAAMRTGVAAARAPIVAVLDGDGQNDPADIPALYAALALSPETRMAVGERRRRHDSWTRRLSSRVANGVRASLLHDGIRDTGCGLKVFYRDDYLDLPAFDHMHRFLPALMQQRGRKVRSIPVNHRPRRNGRSKYGIGNRLWPGIVDLLGVMWLERRRL
ncbi:MAG TPA: glycosyltransferase family 2 protein [Woeseiaceae bacterium]